MRCPRTYVALVALAALALSAPVTAQSAGQIDAALGDIEWRGIGPVNMGGRVRSQSRATSRAACRARWIPSNLSIVATTTATCR